MSDLKWIKFDVWLFDRAEFKYLAKKENGSELQLCWIRLLCEAAKRNDGGRVYISKNIPIDAEEISILLDMSLDVVEDALFIFEACDLIKFDNEVGLVIRNFSDYVGEGFFEADDDFLSGESDAYPDQKMPLQAEKSATSSTESRKKIKDMTPDEKREYYRNRKKVLRARKSEAGQIKACPKENLEAVQNTNNNVQNTNNNVQNTNNNVQNTNNNVQNANNGVQNIHNGVQNYDTSNVQKEFGIKSQNVQNSPKNIFIEENRIDKSRIEDKRIEKIREEKENYNISSLSHGVCEYASDNEESYFGGKGISDFADGSLYEDNGDNSDFADGSLYEDNGDNSDFADGSSEESKAPFNAYASRTLDFDNAGTALPLGSDNENSGTRTHTQKITEKRDKRGYGIFNNVYLSDYELSDLNGRYGYEVTKRLSDELSTKMESEGVRYKSHYATLIRWAECEATRKADNRNKARDNADYGNGNYGNGESDKNSRDAYSLNNGYRERKKGLQGEPYKPKKRYGDFDAEEAFRLALERTEREWAEMGYTTSP